MPDDETLKRFGEAVEEKKQRSKEDSESEPSEAAGGGPPAEGDQADLVSDARTQDDLDTRAKSSRKGKVTADKWNQ